MPAILHSSIPDNIEPKLNWLQKCLSLTDDELSKIVEQYPALFSYNIDNNLEPKLNFNINASLGDENEALALVAHTCFVWYSLENRLKPRLQEALDAAGCK